MWTQVGRVTTPPTQLAPIAQSVSSTEHPINFAKSLLLPIAFPPFSELIRTGKYKLVNRKSINTKRTMRPIHRAQGFEPCIANPDNLKPQSNDTLYLLIIAQENWWPSSSRFRMVSRTRSLHSAGTESWNRDWEDVVGGFWKEWRYMGSVIIVYILK